ncbi:MAG: hypothetical protein HON70_42820, partial [Lentisphaerae bacterium]|nr:hypothetical protein [Lentisphaerota bacterium]
MTTEHAAALPPPVLGAFSDTLEHEAPRSTEEEVKDHVRDPVDVRNLAKVLRVIGAVAIIAAAVVCLFKQWPNGDDIRRYATLLGFTALLPIAAFFCGLRIQEKKGARTLLGLAITVLPVHFAVLGGLLYSRFAMDATTGSVPAFALWVAPSDTTALATTGVALVLLAPLAFVSYLTFARGQALRLTLACVGLNLLLLIPMRDSHVVAGLVVGMVGALSVMETRLWRSQSRLTTVEGRWARATLWLPLLFVVGRGLHLYAVSRLLSSVLWGAGAFLLFSGAPALARKRWVQAGLQILSTGPAAVSWGLMVTFLDRQYGLPREVLLPLATLPFAVLLTAMSLFCRSSGCGYRRAAAVIALAGAGMNLLMYPGALASACCLFVAVTGLTYGFIAEQKLIFVAGLAAAVLAFVHYIHAAIR